MDASANLRDYIIGVTPAKTLLPFRHSHLSAQSIDSRCNTMIQLCLIGNTVMQVKNVNT